MEFLTLCIKKLISSAVLRLSQRDLRIGNQLRVLRVGKIIVTRDGMQRLMNISDEVNNNPEGLQLRELREFVFKHIDSAPDRVYPMTKPLAFQPYTALPSTTLITDLVGVTEVS
jgi:hypothetical protein